MKKYEYKIISPPILDGKFLDGFITETTKNIFGKDKTVYKDKTISESEWLNKKGQEGWELVHVLRNGYNHDLKEYYFKREITE